VAPPATPVRLSGFIGRRRELTELRRLSTHARLLTIAGTGGVGKTRLAVQLADLLVSRFPDGVVFVDLGGAFDQSLIEDVVARALGVALQGVRGADALYLPLRGRRMLMILDNCEQVVEGAARLAADLLVECPELAIVATSRERLNIEGELCYSCPPLSLPPESGRGREEDSDALRLFVNRAHQVRPDFLLSRSNLDAVTAICHRLEGIPLAIELAAARMLTMTPADLLPRLEDRLGILVGGARNGPDRQQTLRATLDWSYELLSENERLLLRRISIFNGERDAVTIAAVCGAAPLGGPALPLNLGRLVDKSMVQARPDGDTMVYRLLQTVRQYAAGKLAESAEAGVLTARHLEHYRALAAGAFTARRVRGALPEQRRLWHEIDDVRSALDTARSDPATELEVLGHLGSIWMMYAPDEGRRRIGNALLGARKLPEGAWWQAAEVHLALSGRTGDHSQSAIYKDAVHQQAQAEGDIYAQGRGLQGAAFTAERRDGDLEAARRHMIAAADLLETVPVGPDLVLTLQSLGSLERQLGNLDAARDAINRSVSLAREVEDPYNEIGGLFHLGWLELDHGDLTRAIEAFGGGLDLADDSDLLSIAHQAEGVAVALVSTDRAAAATLFGAAARLRTVIDSPLHSPWLERVTRANNELQAVVGEDEWNRSKAAADAMASSKWLREVVARLRRPAARTKSDDGGLSRREMEVARLVAQGLSNRAIAEKLFRSERTVHSHLTHILTKLGFDSRAQLASWVTGRQL
jgi:predicted ATPase/DNA-binding CsgD family transcriptional regulator